MQYMVVEHYLPGKVKEVYQRFAEKGRMLPEGVRYINSWINEDVTVCYQLMEADSVALLQQWINKWNDLVDFEIVSIISSDEAKEKALSLK